jgi:hypothetical protein
MGIHISVATRYMKLSGDSTMRIAFSASNRSRAAKPALSRYHLNRKVVHKRDGALTQKG